MFNLKIARRLGVEGRFDQLFRPLLVVFNSLKIKLRNNPKIVVIGFNKTGTTSVFVALKELGYNMSNQHDFERLYNAYLKREIQIDNILKRCSYHEVFQDIPFSLPGFYKEVDKKYPKSKFILTVRSDSDTWYNSFNKYYGGKEKLINDDYIEKGFLYNIFKSVFNSDKFGSKECINAYERHTEDVKKYFKRNKKQLLVLDVSENESYSKLCFFLNKKAKRKNFQWKNKTN